MIGSGPIVIGQACEFDYSGTQAIKALKAEGLEVILVNSNPATIMTDPELSDRTYVEPLIPEALEKIIAIERPDAILPTVGGQTALNLAVQLDELGILKKYKIELIGASSPAIKVAEDRLLFRDAMKEIGVVVPERRRQDARRGAVDRRAHQVPRDHPSVVHDGGVGGGIAYNLEEFRKIAGRGLHLSPFTKSSSRNRSSAEGIRARDARRRRQLRRHLLDREHRSDGVHTGDSITAARR